MSQMSNQTVLFNIKYCDVCKFGISGILMERPKLLGFYTYNYENYAPAQYVKYFKEPQPQDYPLDLNKGYSTCRFREPSTVESRLHLPLRYAMSSVEVSSTSTLNYHKRSAIYTGRRVLTKIMQWCYEKKFDFHVLVSRYNGNLYMAGDRSWEGIPSNVHHKRFEQLLFADSPEKPPNCDEPINENITQSVLHRCKLGNYEILYAGEAQGIISEEKIENLDDMEALDKCRFVFTKQLWANVKDKENKFLTYWIQSYLSAIDDIYVGYKSFGGFVETPIECIKISDMPGKYSWDPAVCFGFLNYFLEQVEQLMSKVNCLHTVYEFTFRVRDKATVYEIYEGNSDKSFIPQFYADFVARGSPMETNDETN